MRLFNKKPKSLLKKYTDVARRGQVKPFTNASRDWFMDMISGGELKVSRRKLLKDPIGSPVTQPKIGRMYMFIYDPKHKKTLPYYDRFPLIIFADIPEKGKGFYGLNLHYLRPRERAVFLTKLMNNYSNTGRTLEDNTKLKISYQLLKSASKMRAFAPTFKRYLPNHIKSQIVEIPPEHWETAIFLPSQNFKKAKVPTVWKDSKNAYR